MHDVIVIGGGPAGNKAAALLADEYDVLVIEEHAVSGRPVQCTGLVSDEVIELSNVRPTVINELYGANIIFPNGKTISVRSKERKAVLIDRYEFDTLMYENAKKAGAEHLFSTRYGSHETYENEVRIRTNNGELSASMIVGADGQNSGTARSITDNGPAEYVRGIQLDVDHRMDDQDMIDIRIGSEVAPGFFSWEIPFGDTTRIGLCTSRDSGPPSEYLKTLLKRTGLDDRKVIGKYCGKIPIGGRRSTYAERMLLIGDAAGHVKPISGGGLQPAFRSSYAAAETIREAFDENNFSKEFLSVYEKRWKKDIGKELNRGYRLRRMFLSMNDDELNKVHGIINKERIKEELNSGSVDHPSDMLLSMIRHPVTILRLAPFLLRMIS